MPILYTVVANKNVVLARHATTIGNFAEVIESVLSRIDASKGKKMSYSSDSYMFHYVLSDQNLTFLCITDNEFRRTSAFDFLDAIQEKFAITFRRRSAIASNTVPMSLNTDFSPIVASEMKKFNLTEDQNKLMPAGEGEESASTDKISRIRGDVETVMHKMEENVEAIVTRGERLELLMDRSEDLSQNSIEFKRAGTTLQRRMWWQNWRLKIGVGLGIIIGIYIIVSISCGGLDWRKCV